MDANPASATFRLEVQGEADLPIPVLSLVLQPYNLADIGVIYHLDDIYFSTVQDVYQQALIRLAKEFDLRPSTGVPNYF